LQLFVPLSSFFIRTNNLSCLFIIFIRWHLVILDQAKTGKIMAFWTTAFMEPAVDPLPLGPTIASYDWIADHEAWSKGRFIWQPKVVADHQLIMRVLIVNPSGGTMTTTVVVRQGHRENSSYESVQQTGANEPACRDRRRHDDRVQLEDVYAVPLRVVTAMTHLSGSMLAKGKAKLL
jgi:hypothetical protein